MMRQLTYPLTLLAALALGACSSGGSDDSFSSGGGGAGSPPGVTVSSVQVLASSPQLPSDGAMPATITVLVRDANNLTVEGAQVLLSASSGILATPEGLTTNSDGVVTATLNTAGDPTNRDITVSADAAGVTDSVTVSVVGTTLAIQGPDSLAQGDMADYTFVLTDAAGNGIGGQTIDVTSANGNTLSSASLTTDAGGQAQVQFTASAPGDDTLSATALGITTDKAVSVSNDSFVITTPAAGTEVNLNTPVNVTVSWSVGGTPQANQTINFSTTRGTLSASSATTDAQGEATVSVQSSNAGPAVISATNPQMTTTSVQIEFVATVAAAIEVQANPFSVSPNGQSTITAIVRDPANNLVKNKTVVFQLDDVTGGSLSVSSAVTDTQGRAQTFYTASSSTSANNGVTITATVQDTPSVNDSVQLTVAQRELFISIGTGNEIFEPNSAQYRKEYVVQVTDSQGNGVEDVTVSVDILSEAYYKGDWVLNSLATPPWQRNQTAGPCADEDVNRNGVLDPGEDFNNSGRIEAGNIATAAPQGGSGGTFQTDVNGFGIIDVFYPQEFATWVDVVLEASTSVQGTEFAEASNFRLPISGEDISDANQEPPGNPSPFGNSDTCADTL